jgi:hypothetical protein
LLINNEQLKVLALTHAQLNSNGLSPVSCERADGFVFAWVTRCKWQVDIIYTEGTIWAGPWADGVGLPVNVIHVSPTDLIFQSESFRFQIKFYLRALKFKQFFLLLIERFYSQMCFYFPLPKLPFFKARLWANKVVRKLHTDYDLIFVSSGRGDEYLLETGYRLSKLISAPLVIDFRDLFSEHHDKSRFNEVQRRNFKNFELKVFKRTLLISTPQAQDVELLSAYATPPVVQVPHSYYILPEWEQNLEAPTEFVVSYAGKLYSDSDGYKLFLDFIKIINSKYKKVFFKVFTNEVNVINTDIKKYDLTNISVFSWQTPDLIWREMRKSRLSLIYNSSVAEGRNLLPTKAIMSAATGNSVLFLFSYYDKAVAGFLATYNCGGQFTTIDKAIEWFEELYKKSDLTIKQINLSLPERMEVGYNFGLSIEMALRN